MRAVRTASVLATSAVLAWGCLASAAPVDFGFRGVTIEKEITVAAPPLEAWNAFTGDVSGWWDHHFSKTPLRLFIDRKPGGAFWEIFDEEGHGVKHAEVIYADPGKELRLRGPLGFSGDALDLVMSFTFTAEGEGTKLHLKVNALGQLDDNGIEALDRAWDHFLGNFQAYVASGKHRGKE